MEENLRKLKKYIRLMRENGVLTLKMDGIELNLAPSALSPNEPKLSSDNKPIEEEKIDPLETLLWSAPSNEFHEAQ